MSSSSGPSMAAAALLSAHRDVLEAPIPTTSDGRNRLVEELQSRGRAAVGAKSWMDAKLLYDKALQVLSSEDDDAVVDKPRMALLHSNSSLVLGTMGSWKEAQEHAQTATTLDPKYVKGWWRLGQAHQALSNYEDALTALKQAKVLDPNNKALMKEIHKVQQQAEAAAKEREAKKKEQENENGKQQQNSRTNGTHTKSTTTTTTTKPATSSSLSSSTSASPAPMDVDDDDDDAKLFTKSEPVRGYKVVNGKKTSYFHNELSEEAKQLIGDIRPQKLDPTTAAAAATTTTASATAPQGTSAWNQAGTWEEKDVTTWATNSLKEKVMSTTFILPQSSPAPNAMVHVTKIGKVTGHASVATARGKTRFIYEYSLENIEWHMTGNATTTSSEPLDCRGKVSIPDIDGTIELGEGYEMIQFTIDHVSDNSVRPLLERFVQRGGFHDALNESIDDWVRLFQATYK